MLSERSVITWQRLLLLALIFGFLGSLHVMDLRGEEPRRALISWEMVLSGNWWQPTELGWPYYNKPPVFNWLVAALFDLGGYPYRFLLRLPSILALLATAWIQFRWVACWINQSAAWWSVLFLLTGAHYLFFGTVLSGELDIFYALMVVLQAFVLFWGKQHRHFTAMFVGSYLLMAIGFLTKGLPSIPFQVCTIVGLAWIDREWKWLFHWSHPLGILIGFGLIAAYFGGYETTYGHGWSYLANLTEEAAKKSGGESRLPEVALHFFVFPLEFLALFLPWSFLVYHFRQRAVRQALRAHPLLQFSLIFILINIWLYWLSPDSRDRYLYPFFPFVAMILGWVYDGYGKVSKKRMLIILTILLAARLGYNYMILPVQKRNMEGLAYYRSIGKGILEDSQGDPVVVCGPSDTLFINPSIGPITLLTDTLWAVPNLPRQIYLQVTLEKGHILPFRMDKDLGPDTLYLSTDSLGLEGSRIRTYKVWGDTWLSHWRNATY